MAAQETGSPEQQLPEGRPDDEHEGAGAKPDIFPTEYAPADVADVEELAEAERAVARRGATPEQLDGTARAGQARRAEERLEGWRRRHH